jgi:hypothetical protein
MGAGYAYVALVLLHVMLLLGVASAAAEDDAGASAASPALFWCAWAAPSRTLLLGASGAPHGC